MGRCPSPRPPTRRLAASSHPRSCKAPTHVRSSRRPAPRLLTPVLALSRSSSPHAACASPPAPLPASLIQPRCVSAAGHGSVRPQLKKGLVPDPTVRSLSPIFLLPPTSSTQLSFSARPEPFEPPSRPQSVHQVAARALMEASRNRAIEEEARLAREVRSVRLLSFRLGYHQAAAPSESAPIPTAPVSACRFQVSLLDSFLEDTLMGSHSSAPAGPGGAGSGASGGAHAAAVLHAHVARASLAPSPGVPRPLAFPITLFECFAASSEKWDWLPSPCSERWTYLFP